MTWAQLANYLQGHQVWHRYSYKRHLPLTMTMIWAVSSGIAQQVALSLWNRSTNVTNNLLERCYKPVADPFNSVPMVHEFLKYKNHWGFIA